MKFFWRAKRDDAQSAALLKTQSDAADEGASETTESTQEAGSKGDMANSQAPAANENSEVDAKQDAEKQDASRNDSDSAGTAHESNVVALQPSRLTERIAAAAVKTVTTLTPSEPVASVPQRAPSPMPTVANDADIITPRAAGPLPGQEAAYDLLDRLLANPRAAGSILVLGPMGSGRRRAIETQLERHRDVMPRPHDWLYVVSAAEGGRLRSFAMPHGQGKLLAREAKAAISKARANHERLVASDEFRLGLEIIDEEFRHKSGKTLETLKRRAEEQNIALVKTPDGFVLAPMHEGKVVRNDVFRALPEKLQRDVEAKIADLEGELKAFIEAIPDDDTHHAERIASFNRDAAARAVKPHLEPVRLAFNDCSDFVDELQASLIAATAAAQRSAEGVGSRTLPAALASVQVFNVQTAADFSQPAPVVLAQDVTPAGLLGEIGVDAAGQLVLAPGALARANGGYLVLEAWRLVADPSAWCVLSRVLAEGAMRPLVRGGLMLEVDALPFSGRLIVVADEASHNKLLALDPGARRHFPHVVRFRASLPRSAFDVADYAAFAARVAQQSGLRSIASNAAEALYRSALADSGDNDQLKLDTHALVNLLHDADVEAAASGASHIRAHDIETAAKRAGEARLT
ncbi:MAG: AAA family ATPase [Hyphomicrobiaceae bacterium]